MNFFAHHKKILASLMILVIVFGVLVLPVTGSVAHAADSVGETALEHGLYPFLAPYAYAALVASSVFLRITGYMLNSAIVATLNISDIVNSVKAIESTWLIIRNFSNIFFIFMLLYAGIVMILDTKGPKFGELVKNIVIAGLLINFSLFFTKLAIDTSNIVALSFYKAIDGASVSRYATLEGISAEGVIKSALTESDVGLSNAFMQGLKIQTIYSNTGKLINPIVGVVTGVTLNILLATAGGAVIMVIVGISFLVAAVMFLARLAILIILMAFSPIFFIGMVLPEVQPYAKKWLDELVAQCIFAPLYLMFMYVVLRIVTDPAFGAIFGVTETSNFAQEIASGGPVGLIIQYAIIIILINYGLVASKQYAGSAAKLGDKVHKWANKATSTYGYGLVARQTVGRAAAALDERFANSASGNSQLGRGLRSITTGAIMGTKWGGDRSFADDKKDAKEVATKQREIDNKAKLALAIRGGVEKEIKEALDKMSDSEIAKLGKKTLTNALVIPHLSSGVYKAIEKSEMGDADKMTILDTRKQQLAQYIKEGKTDKVANLIKNFDNDERKAMLTENITKALGNQKMIGVLIRKEKGQDLLDLGELLAHPEVAQKLSESQLKEMTQMDGELLKRVAVQIRSSPSSVGRGYINKNPDTWGPDTSPQTNQGAPVTDEDMSRWT